MTFQKNFDIINTESEIDMFPTFYKVRFWDECSSTVIKVSGFMFADSPSDATTKLEKYYGSKEIESFKIFMLEENYLLEMKEDNWNRLLEEAGGSEDI